MERESCEDTMSNKAFSMLILSITRLPGGVSSVLTTLILLQKACFCSSQVKWRSKLRRTLFLELAILFDNSDH